MSKYRTLVANIEYLMRAKGIRNTDMAQRIGIGASTFQNRKNRPEQFTLKELTDIADVLTVPMTELFETHFN